MRPRRRSPGGVTVFIVVLFACGGAHARAIDDVRLSRVAEEATIEIELGCAMRYDSHSPLDGNSELYIRMTLGNDCHLALRTGRSDLRHPAGGRMASLAEIAFDADQRDQAVITLRFERPVRGEVRQTTNLYLLTVVLGPGAPATPQPAAPLPEPARATVAAATPASPRREPMRLVRTLPYGDEDRFAIRLSAFEDSTDLDREALVPFSSQVFYVVDVPLGDHTMKELRMGFFPTEEEAGRALARLGASFPSAWIAVADAGEQAEAAEQRIDAAGKAKEAARDVAIAAAHETPADAGLSEERIATMMSEAKNALVRRDYARSIDLYSRLLQEPAGAHRREAREFLGVAFEKNGQPANARDAYEVWLDEFPDGPDANRVRQRLAALTTTAPAGERKAPQTTLAAASEDAPDWEIYGSASQYYLRGVSLAHDSDDDDVVGQSALLSRALLFARRSGERFDVASRANLGYLHDFVEDGSGDQALVSYAYIDVADAKTDISARLGRQRPHAGGVLGRFDGVSGSYRWRPDLTVHVSAGFPVDSPRFRATSDQWFYGAGIDLDNVFDAWDFGVFTNIQTVDGVADRHAVGAEVQYHSQRVNVAGLVDYDASYEILNAGFITGNWRINDRLTVHGRYRGGAAPFLTTRNAIIGQPVNTLRELFPDYTEGQLRSLARNRTAEERAGSAGLSTALTPRLQLKADVSWLEYNATPASGGVAAFPETGPQVSWGGHLLGSGFFRAGHLFLVGYRHDETESVDTDTVFVDVRQPVGERLRIQTRLDVSQRVANQNPAGDIDQWIANPMLRISCDWAHRYRVEFEVGAQWSNRKFPAALTPPLVEDNAIEQTDYYLQLGYILDF